MTVTGHFRPRASAREPFDLACWLLLGGLLLIVLLTFRDYGISNDEEVQHRYGEMIVAYYASGFADQTLFQYKNLYLYGGLFDIIAALLARALPFDLWLIRHLLSALAGIAGIGAAAATARLIAGPRAAFFAAALLSICGIWFGSMFNHTKDIPFAAAMMGAGYFLCRTAFDLPRPRWRDVIGFGILLGAALGLRALGLLLVAYLALLVAVCAPWRQGPRATAAFMVGSGLHFLPGLVLAYAIMIASWPWASLDLLNPFRAVFAFAHFQYPIRTIIAGQVFWMGEVPRWYVPAYVAIKLPLVIFFGAAIAVFLVFYSDDQRRRFGTSIMAMLVLIPLGCEAIAQGPAFTGMRHFLFIVPPLVVLAAAGLDEALARMTHWRLRASALAGLVLLLASYAAELVRLHPYESLAYNSLVGGLPHAARRYEMDYWVNVMPEAVRALENYLDHDPDAALSSAPFTVGVCGERFAFEHYASSRLRWTGGWKEADFFIAPTQLDCDRAEDGDVVATIVREGAVIGVVKDHRQILRSDLARRR
jgi:hypothetical protein